MVTHSSILAWRIPWREEPGALQSMGLQSPTGFTDKPIQSPSHSPVYGWSVLQQPQETYTKKGQGWFG